MANKYGNKITMVGDLRFHSRGEARRWGELQLLETAKQIKELKRQTKHTLVCNGVKVGTYTDDFSYNEGEFFIIEDFKGVRTALFTLKWNILKAMYKDNKNIVFRVTSARG